MLEQTLTLRKLPVTMKITCQTLVSVVLIALAVALPQAVHLALGQPGGIQLLPMYFPVLIGGCLLGAKWGIAVGALSPMVSWMITSSMGNAMPALSRLPFMVFELMIFALVSGLFFKKIFENKWWAFLAVITAQLCGRAGFLLAVAVFQSAAPFSVNIIWSQICTGWFGLLAQAVLVPIILIGVRTALIREQNDD